MAQPRTLALEDIVTTDAIGIAVAIVLLALMRALLPQRSRSLVRQPVAFLTVHALARALAYVLPPETAAARIVSLIAVVFLFASMGRSAVLLVLDVVVEPRLARPLPRIIRDIVQGLVYVVLLLISLRSAGVEPSSILTTSALLTAAIALSMQETLGNLVAGLAIQAQQPFEVDDWIQFDDDPKHIGRVIEINWRATKVATLDEVEVIIPNSTLAKAPITNFTKPTVLARRSVYVHVPAHFPPHTVKQAILGSLTDTEGVLAEPAPSVVTSAFTDGNVEYWVRYYTDRFHVRDVTDGVVRDRVWYALSRARIPVAAPNRAVRLREVSNTTQAMQEAQDTDHREIALAHVDFFHVLSAEQRRKLAETSRIHLYGAGEPIVRQGERTAEMFIVQSGEVSVQREEPGAVPIEVARLGAGAFFGEMALMTGELRMATVRARSECSLIGIDQKAFKAVLESSPELAALISRAIAERQAAAERATASSRESDHPENVEERSSLILNRIRKFFSL